jgi:PAS domain S-box-containing protein/diguanylate cyclase (GGDEF)-like protein
MKPASTPHLPIADLLDILPDAVVMVDARGTVVFANPALHALLGHEAAAIVGQPLSVLVPPAARERHEAMVARYRRVGQPTMMGSRPVLHAVHKSGQLVPVSISLCNLVLEGGETMSVAVMHDVSTLQTSLDRATRIAETDALTGIGNRLRLSRRMQALLANARPFAVLRVDVATAGAPGEGGPHADDELLRIAAQRLQAKVRDNDVAARLEGARFVLLFDGLDDPAALEARAAAALQRLASPLRGAHTDAGAQRTPLAHVGGAIHPRHGLTEAELLAAAGDALERARAAGLPYCLAQP